MAGETKESSGTAVDETANDLISPVTPEHVLRRMIGAIDEADDEKLSSVIHPEADLGSLIAKRRLLGRNEVIRAFAEKRRRGLLRITLLSVENLTETVGLAHASVRRPIEPSGFADSTVYYLFEIDESQVRWADYFPNRETAHENFKTRQDIRTS